MALEFAGSLPVSGVNIGLQSGVTALGVEIDALGEDIVEIQAGAAAQVTYSASLPPNIPTLAAQFTAALTLANLTNQLNPTNWVTVGATANGEFLAQLGILNGFISLLSPIVMAMEAGLSTGGLYAWSYAGRARAFGTRLRAATQYGFGSTGPSQNVNAVIIAAAEHSSWASFSAGVYVGTSADEDLGTETTQEALISLGALNGYQLDTGVLSLYAGWPSSWRASRRWPPRLKSRPS